LHGGDAATDVWRASTGNHIRTATGRELGRNRQSFGHERTVGAVAVLLKKKWRAVEPEICFDD
jgi:hypothetical protein